jgi:gamma-glutamyl hercynylcysteine S-oxide synthase
MTTSEPQPPTKSPEPAARLEEVRERTLLLVGHLDWPVLRRQHIPLLSPIVWDLGHIGHFEELWIGQRLGGRTPLAEGFERMFDPERNPRPTREGLPLPERDELFAYLARVREQTVEVLARAPHDSELARGGYAVELVAEHEEQHQETILQALQALESPPYRPPERRGQGPGAPSRAAGEGARRDMVRVPAGPFPMGWKGPGFAYDNELPQHLVEVPEVLVDRFPVSEAEYLAFVEEGGYRRRDHWSPAGWEWCRQDGAEAPRNWRRRDGGWQVRAMDRWAPPDPRVPVAQVCWYEAEAYCRFVGKRLLTEAEWEKAALWDPETGASRRYPWGDHLPTAERANLDQLAFGPGPAEAVRGGASALGVEQMLGDVWEWTASDFLPYPGFRAFPYREYSEVFFGSDYKVLRGGSWATRTEVARGTFRNWDYPIRRQIFAGFRCAQDGS